MNDETQDRLQKLEAHVAHLEHQLEQLNEVLVDQGKWISRLRKEVQRQSDTLQTGELDRIQSNNQKPPHHEPGR
ncbi:MAG: SlyX family protein [Akkermansiaceae bacterium]|nr:SlyX family protein [Verrucomicrobiales bacterium]